jgi:glycosyltransferase involved in cell wall biosynthesis
MTKKSLTVAVPALNESENIRATIENIIFAAENAPNLEIKIIVIDDGSKDNTSEIVKQLAKNEKRIRLITNPINIGLGASIRNALIQAETEKFIFIPGDNDIPPETLSVIFANAYLADMVMCYFLNDECRGRMRYILSNMFTMIYTSIFDIYIKYINGPAVYPVKELLKLNLTSNRFSIIAEINAKMLRKPLTFAELACNRQKGLLGSTSLSIKSLIETIKILINTFFEIYLLKPSCYKKRAKRINYQYVIKELRIHD